MNEIKIEELLPIYDQVLYTTALNAIENGIVENFKGSVLILHQEKYLTPETGILLSKMLTACGLHEADYKIISTSQAEVLAILNLYSIETALLFDLSLDSESFTSLKEKYKPFRFAGKKYLLSDSLQTIASNNSLKSSLWVNGLKPLFNIS